MTPPVCFLTLDTAIVRNITGGTVSQLDFIVIGVLNDGTSGVLALSHCVKGLMLTQVWTSALNNPLVNRNLRDENMGLQDELSDIILSLSR